MYEPVAISRQFYFPSHNFRLFSPPKALRHALDKIASETHPRGRDILRFMHNNDVILTLLANSAEILCVVTVRAVKHKCISTGQKQTNKYEIVSAHGSTNTRGKRY